MLWMLAKKVGLASQYSGQIRKKWFMDSMSPPQIQMGFIIWLKPCLNLCSVRWVIPRHNLVNSFIPYGLEISKILLGEGVINSNSLFFLNSNISRICHLNFSLEFVQLSYWRGKKIVSEVIMLDSK